MDDFLKACYLMLPLLFGLAFHGACMKFGWLSWLAKPIDAGVTWHCTRLFGENKTYRGLIAVAFGTTLGVAIQLLLHRIGVGRNLEILNYGEAKVILIGFAMGTAAMLAELPNSFIKRQLKIAPGTAATGFPGLFFYVMDQIDMLAGVWLVLSFALSIKITLVLYSAIFLFIAHQLLTITGYALGMRATAR